MASLHPERRNLVLVSLLSWGHTGHYSPTLKVIEGPVLQLRIINAKELGHRLWLAITFSDGECEFLIRRKANRLGTVLGSMYLQTDVEVLSSQEIGPKIVQSTDAPDRDLQDQLLTGQVEKHILTLLADTTVNDLG